MFLFFIDIRDEKKVSSEFKEKDSERSRMTLPVIENCYHSSGEQAHLTKVHVGNLTFDGVENCYYSSVELNEGEGGQPDL